MSEEIKKRMDLSRLKKFLDSSQNIELLSGTDELVDFSSIDNTHLRMLKLTNEPSRFIAANSNQQEIDSWLLSSYDSFNLGDIFYMRLEDFPAAHWVKVKTYGKAQDWLLPIYHQLTNGWIQIAPLNLEYVFEFRQQEHRFSTFVEKV
jgi:hypothetical protein